MRESVKPSPLVACLGVLAAAVMAVWFIRGGEIDQVVEPPPSIAEPELRAAADAGAVAGPAERKVVPEAPVEAGREVSPAVPLMRLRCLTEFGLPVAGVQAVIVGVDGSASGSQRTVVEGTSRADGVLEFAYQADAIDVVCEKGLLVSRRVSVLPGEQVDVILSGAGSVELTLVDEAMVLDQRDFDVEFVNRTRPGVRFSARGKSGRVVCALLPGIYVGTVAVAFERSPVPEFVIEEGWRVTQLVVGEGTGGIVVEIADGAGVPVQHVELSKSEGMGRERKVGLDCPGGVARIRGLRPGDVTIVRDGNGGVGILAVDSSGLAPVGLPSFGGRWQLRLEQAGSLQVETPVGQVHEVSACVMFAAGDGCVQERRLARGVTGSVTFPDLVAGSKCYVWVAGTDYYWSGQCDVRGGELSKVVAPEQVEGITATVVITDRSGAPMAGVNVRCVEDVRLDRSAWDVPGEYYAPVRILKTSSGGRLTVRGAAGTRLKLSPLSAGLWRHAERVVLSEQAPSRVVFRRMVKVRGRCVADGVPCAAAVRVSQRGGSPGLRVAEFSCGEDGRFEVELAEEWLMAFDASWQGKRGAQDVLVKGGQAVMDMGVLRLQ